MLDRSKINKSIPIPLYFQVKEIILNEIKNGDYKRDDMIPTEKELSELFDVSLTPLRQAIYELVQEGWLYRIKSKGTFVSSPKINQDFVQSLDSFKEQFVRSGRLPFTELLDLEILSVPEYVAEILHLDPADKVIYIHRKRGVDQEPVVMVKTYLPYAKCSFVLNHDLEKESLYQILENQDDTRIFRIKRLIEAVDAVAYDINHLNIKRGKAIHQFKSTGFNIFGDPIEYSVARYRGDRNAFEVVIAPSEASVLG
jgi:GntR family transcriptional regulator